MSSNAFGGNDALTGGVLFPTRFVVLSENDLYGDAYAMFDNSRGGDDTMIGGDGLTVGDGSNNFLYGDAYTMSNDASGGDDTLTGGVHASNVLVGDAQKMHDDAHGGNDTLRG